MSAPSFAIYYGEHGAVVSCSQCKEDFYVIEEGDHMDYISRVASNHLCWAANPDSKFVAEDSQVVRTRTYKEGGVWYTVGEDAEGKLAYSMHAYPSYEEAIEDRPHLVSVFWPHLPELGK